MSFCKLSVFQSLLVILTNQCNVRYVRKWLGLKALVYVLATKLLLCSASNTCNCIDAKVKPVCIRILWAQNFRELKHRHFWDADGKWMDDVTTVTFGAKPLFSWFFSKTYHMLKGKELSSTISPLHLRNGYTSSSVHIITTAMTNFLENFHVFVQVILYKIAAHFTAISSFLNTTCKELHWPFKP